LELPAHLELNPAWRELRMELRRAVGDSTYDIWLSGIEPKAWDGLVLVVEAPAATRAWVAERFGRVLERCARMVLGPAAKVAFTGEPAHRIGTGTTGTVKSAPDSASAVSEAARLERFMPRYTFDQFIIGDGNRLAHAAALTVAESPGDTYNPLFLCAPPGLGKTHLLHAIGNFISAFDPTTTVRYTTVEAFTNGFVSAIQARALDRFKHLYREVDVLLIDDVQFLASKAKTEEEFFHTFNALYDQGRQLVVTCDRVPQQLTGLEERLRERFESGLVAELAPPDFSTRLAILRKRAALDHISVADPNVLELIADRVTDNVRSLEGALIRIVAHHSLTGRPIDVSLAEMVLADVATAASRGRPAKITIDAIRTEVAAYFDLDPVLLVSSSRAARIAWARQVAIHLSRELTETSLQAIGAAFGGRNHATVLHACRRVAERVSSSPEDAADVAALAARVAPQP